MPEAEGQLERLVPVAGPAPAPEDEVTGLRCEAGATSAGRTLALVLEVDAERPPTLAIEVDSALGEAVEAPDGRFGAAEQTRANRRAELGDTAAARAQEPATFLDADDPVPEDAADRLPEAPTTLAGGDVCSFVASPDGTTVLVSVGRG